MSEPELFSAIQPYLKDLDTCQDDNQLDFIMMFISQNICYVDRNKLFDFAKKHVRKQDNIKDVFDKFLIDNNCCASGYKNCGTGCINIMNNFSNCGECGNACLGTGQNCVQGNCVCPSGQVLCGSVCVDTTNNPNNCGKCGGTPCQSNICSKSVCKPYYSSVVATNISTNITIGIQPPAQEPNFDDGTLYKLNLQPYIDTTQSGTAQNFENVKFTNNSILLSYALPKDTNSVIVIVYKYNVDGTVAQPFIYTGQMDVRPAAPGP